MANEGGIGPVGGFNSRPREGATRPGLTWPRRPHEVSTHAPARGRLDLLPRFGVLRIVSTHAPARGRPGGPAPPAGLDPVSTHAPARGRPDAWRRYSRGRQVSTHAPARGRHGAGNCASKPSARFQLTPPRGGDVHIPIMLRRDYRFNSRPREGATFQIAHMQSPVRAVSTHAPARGRQESTYRAPEEIPVSTHAPARGRPGEPSIPELEDDGFNSRPREGATRSRL